MTIIPGSPRSPATDRDPPSRSPVDGGLRRKLAAGPVLATTALLVSLVGCGELQEEQEERLSPLDSVSAVVAGTEIEVQYGRPSMRDRVIFGELVPWGEIWRTGANEATHIRTDADLLLGDSELGETELPAGHYTLFTIPERDAWTLVVNTQTGQWGTQYDPERDLVRLPMRVDELESAVDTFTIRVESHEERDGILILEWERTRAWIPFDRLEAGW